ncbi:MAG: hypothetical protein P1V97_39630, partial [Planctomycetota bacterium]|nr:hypothetical protein [Planctomycetota bacterium]
QGLQLRGTPVPKSINYLASENWLLGKSAFARLGFHYCRRAQYSEEIAKGYELSHALLRAFQSFLKDRNTPFLIVLQAKDQGLKDFFTKEKISFIDVSEAEQFKAFGKHWTPKGHKSVVQKLEARFKEHSPIR